MKVPYNTETATARLNNLKYAYGIEFDNNRLLQLAEECYIDNGPDSARFEILENAFIGYAQTRFPKAFM